MSSSIYRTIITTLFIFFTAASAQAATITVGGTAYESVDWSSVSNPNDNATGTAGGNNVTFQMPSGGFSTASQQANNVSVYQADLGFNAPTITYTAGGIIERVLPRGGQAGTSTLSFGNSISSLLLLIGTPNSISAGDAFQTSVWNFPDNPPLQVSILDDIGRDATLPPNLTPGHFQINAGNELININAGADVRVRGIVQLTSTTPFNTLSWTQQGVTGGDQMSFAVAVGPATVVPTPSAMLLMGTGLIGLIGWNYRKTKKL